MSPPRPRRPGALLDRRARFDGGLASPAGARAVVRKALTEVGRHEWSDLAELAISEIVTNAALHAHTEIEVRVGVYDDEVLVEVHDRNPCLPAVRDYDDEATTGRGMALVAAIATSCGVVSLGDEGKVVWFSVGTGPLDPEALLAQWVVEEVAPSVGRGAATCPILLEAMPATLWLSARQHHDALLRELVLYLAEREAFDVDFAAVDSARQSIFDALTGALDEASARRGSRPVEPDGRSAALPWRPAAVDLRFEVPAGASAAFAAMQDVLDLAESLCVAGELFTRPGLPEIVALRDWACEQVIAQLQGTPPSPWPGTAQERFETALHDRAQPDAPTWDGRRISESSRGVIAADDANRIIAVSRPLADVLGWDPHELVGRRVVTVIPPAMREAHVAGFSRHLSTGEARLLGRRLELPMLRRDRTEVRCSFVVEQAAAGASRSVYLAWVEPLEA